MSKNNYINVLLISGSGLIGGALNYVYHPIMLQYLSLEEFGVFGSLVGLFNILGVILTGVLLFLNKEISNNLNDYGKVKLIFLESFKILSLLGIGCYILYILLSPFIAHFLKIDDTKLLIFVGFSIVLTFFGTSENSALRGLKQFTTISFLSILGPLLKLLIGVGFLLLGFTLYGAIAGFIFASIISLSIGFSIVYKNLKNEKVSGTRKELLQNFYSKKGEIFHFFLISALFAILMNIDVILVKNIFDETTAGIYAGISVLGKFLIFLLLSIETVYYGQIMEYKKNTIPFHLIKNPVFLIIITSTFAIIVNYFLGGFILGLLKKELSDYTYIYILSLVFYSFLAFISFFTKVLIGWGKYYINYIMLFFTVLLFIIVYNFGNDTLEHFVYSFITVGGICVAVIGIIFFKEYKSVNKVTRE